MIPGPLLGYGASLLGGGLTTLFGSKMKKGDPAKEAEMFAMLLQRMGPQMANKFYSSMMGGAMGRQLRMNSMGASNALMGNLRTSLGGNMNSGLGALGMALGGSNYFTNLSRGQADLSNLAWQNTTPLLGLAMQGGIDRANMQDKMRYGLMAAGIGGIGDTLTSFTQDRDPNKWKWSLPKVA